MISHFIFLLHFSMAAMLKTSLVGIIVCLLSITVTAGGWSYCQPGPCLRGQYLDSVSNICQPCQPGYYMDLEKHACHNCFECMKPEEDHQIITKLCSADSNAKLGCKDGYFYIDDGDKREPGSCEKCSQCGDHCVAVPCENITDVVCCSCRYTGHRRENPEESQCARSRKSKVIFDQTPAKLQVTPIATTTQGPDVSQDFQAEHVGPGPHISTDENSASSSPPDPVVTTLSASYKLETCTMRMFYFFCGGILPILIVFVSSPKLDRFLLIPLKRVFRQCFQRVCCYMNK